MTQGAVRLVRAYLASPHALAEREWLGEFCRWAAGDPNLSCDEEIMVTRWARIAAIDCGPLPSRSDAEIIRALADRLGFADDAPVRFPPDSEDAYNAWLDE